MTIPEEMVNHHNYEIDLNDIWLYERVAFFRNEISHEYADRLQSNIRKLIINEDPKRGHTKGQPTEYTYSKYYKRFNEKLGFIEKEFMLDFFFDDETLYSYDKNLIINRETSNYEYWFALKLRQYDSNLFEIDKFLTYQLKENFSKNKPAFTDFLDLLLLQYNDKQMISERVIQTLQVWIAKNSIAKKDEKSDLEINSPDSFTLIKFQVNKNYFSDNSLHIIKIIEELKTAGFIYQKCNPDNFIAILSGKKIDKSDRVNWKETVKSLNYFINLLMDLQKIQSFKTGKWHTASKCFLVKGKEIAPLKLAKPGGGAIKIVELENIVNKI